MINFVYLSTFLRAVAGSVRDFMISCSQQVVVIGQVWLSTQVYIHRTTSSGELDAREYGQCYH